MHAEGVCTPQTPNFLPLAPVNASWTLKAPQIEAAVGPDLCEAEMAFAVPNTVYNARALPLSGTPELSSLALALSTAGLPALPADFWPGECQSPVPMQLLKCVHYMLTAGHVLAVRELLPCADVAELDVCRQPCPGWLDSDSNGRGENITAWPPTPCLFRQSAQASLLCRPVLNGRNRHPSLHC